jgi:DNA polymerase-3 subunit epsilon/ATP-dependent DNA helicase DinG
VRDGHCFLQRARKAAEAAHIVIVNHALLLADVSAGGGAIPAYQHLVVDEAHNLEDAATKQFGGAVSLRRLVESLEGLYRPRGRDAREGGAVTLLKQFPPGGVQMAGEALQAAVMAAADRAEPCFVALSRLIPGTNEDDRLLADRSLRTQPAWEEPERLWDSLDHALKEVAAKASLALSALSAGTSTEGPDVVAEEVETAARRVEEMRLTLSSLMSATGEDTISWLARERDGTASINAAPLDVGPTLWDELFSHKETVIATSATLSAAGSMTHTARRLGLEGPESLVLGSPFDYERSTLLCAFEDLPDPATPGYDEASAASLAALVAAADGRTLALFTSHGALRRAAERVRPMLAEQGITVLAQGVDGQPRQLADHLRRQPRSVVLGTSSFWEGVDIKGDALSLLVIARLPFAVPTDPIHRARSAQYDDPFREYSLPSAILKFRQGFGRLIRDRADRGVVAVLDRRIYDKNYGQQFVSALPRCRTLKADTDAISRRVREWLR